MQQEPKAEDGTENEEQPKRNQQSNFIRLIDFLHRYNGLLNAIGTVVVAIFTGFLAVATLELKDLAVKQSSDMEQSIAIARSAAETARAIMAAGDRASIVVQRITLINFPLPGVRQFPEVKISIANGGRTIGYIKRAVVTIVTTPSNAPLPDQPNYSFPEDHTFVLAITPSETLSKTQQVPTRNLRLEPIAIGEEETNRIGNSDRLFVYGQIQYSDEFSATEGTKISGFCMTYPTNAKVEPGVGVVLDSCGYENYIYNHKSD